jgi:hypothetical protein
MIALSLRQQYSACFVDDLAARDHRGTWARALRAGPPLSAPTAVPSNRNRSYSALRRRDRSLSVRRPQTHQRAQARRRWAGFRVSCLPCDPGSAGSHATRSVAAPGGPTPGAVSVLQGHPHKAGHQPATAFGKPLRWATAGAVLHEG